MARLLRPANRGGQVKPPRNYGDVRLLAQRFAYFRDRMSNDKTLPWVGLGLIADLEVAVRLLTLPEFGEWLNAHPNNELQRWGLEVIDAAESRDELTRLHEDIDDKIPAEGKQPHEAVAIAGETLHDIRNVLVDQGVLNAGDEETPIADLLRVLLA